MSEAEFQTGVFYGMDAADYHAVEAMSASGAKKMIRSPAHYKLMRDEPSEPTPAMQFGTVVHMGVLEPARFNSYVLPAPEVNARMKDGKAEIEAFRVAHPSAIILSAEDHARALRCIDRVREHKAARALLEGAQTEISLFWRDGQFGVPCKARWDIRSHGGITDLKTCADASPDGFARAAANFLYHVSAAQYISASEHLMNESPAFFAFIAVESEPPHSVAVYSLPSNAIMAGRHLMDIALARYRDALASGQWAGYPETIESLPFPTWATRFNT